MRSILVPVGYREQVALGALLRVRARAARPPLTPVALARAAGIEPDDWQRELLASTARRLLVLTARQIGKSTAAAVLAVHVALNVPGSLTLLLSPTLRQSAELSRKCLDVYRAAGRPLEPEAETALRLELSTGSRIVSLPGAAETVRGYSKPALVVVDEAAYVDDGLITSVRPMLAIGDGRLILLTTPGGQRGIFYREWEEGGDGWARLPVPASRCPRISAQFLREERRALGVFFDQEYNLAFLADEHSLFLPGDVDAILSDAPPLFPVLAPREAA
jgi:hypothetical protein